MGFLVELGFDLITGAARAPTALFGFVLRVRVAALNHEILDDAMKARAVVETLFGELLEILHMARRNVRPEFEDHFALGSIDNGNFAHRLESYFLGSSFL